MSIPDLSTLRIVYAPHPALTTPANAVQWGTVDRDELRAIAFRMVELMLQARGCGLAANQIGCLMRLIVVHVPGPKAAWKPATREATPAPMVLINPRIVYQSDEAIARPSGPPTSPDEFGTVEDEGCLSYPGRRLKVYRARRIEVEFLNEWGDRKYLMAAGLLSRCIQHEVDHLDGRTIFDQPGAFS